jgi:hypothetical protein
MGMRDSLVIFTLCIIAILLGGWMAFYAPDSIALFPKANSDKYPSASDTNQPPAEVAFYEVASGSLATVTEQTNYAVYAPDAFTDIWTKIGKPPPPPKIDFNKQDVIAVFAGQQPTGGYSIKIQKIVDGAGKRIVSILLTKPGKNCVTTDAVTAPFDVVSVSASAYVPVREFLTKTVDCQ